MRIKKLDNTSLTLKEFEQVFNRLYRPLCIFSKQYVEDLKQAQDIVQDVFVKVYEDKISFKDKNKVDSYFYTSVRNKSLNHLKSKYANTFKATLEELESLQDDYIVNETVILDTSAIIQNAINGLPEKAAQVIKMSICDYSNKDIADELKISVSTVKGHKQNVYKKFRELLAELRFD